MRHDLFGSFGQGVYNACGAAVWRKFTISPAVCWFIYRSVNPSWGHFGNLSCFKNLAVLSIRLLVCLSYNGGVQRWVDGDGFAEVFGGWLG